MVALPGNCVVTRASSTHGSFSSSRSIRSVSTRNTGDPSRSATIGANSSAVVFSAPSIRMSSTPNRPEPRTASTATTTSSTTGRDHRPLEAFATLGPLHRNAPLAHPGLDLRGRRRRLQRHPGTGGLAVVDDDGRSADIGRLEVAADVDGVGHPLVDDRDRAGLVRRRPRRRRRSGASTGGAGRRNGSPATPGLSSPPAAGGSVGSVGSAATSSSTITTVATRATGSTGSSGSARSSRLVGLGRLDRLDRLVGSSASTADSRVERDGEIGGRDEIRRRRAARRGQEFDDLRAGRSRSRGAVGVRPGRPRTPATARRARPATVRPSRERSARPGAHRSSHDPRRRGPRRRSRPGGPRCATGTRCRRPLAA